MDLLKTIFGGLTGKLLEGKSDTNKAYKGAATGLGLAAAVLKNSDKDDRGWDDTSGDAAEVLAHFFGHLGERNVDKIELYGETAKQAIDVIVKRAKQARQN